MSEAPQILFELIDGSARPCLPRTPDGTTREADGKRYLTLIQAVQATGSAEAELRDRYLAMLADQAALTGPTLPLPLETDGRSRREMLRRARFPHLSEADLDCVLEFCRQHNLSPWSGHVWAAPDRDGAVNPLATVDGLRVIAMRTGEHAGRIGPLWCGPDGAWVDAWLKDGPPVAAKVGIRRRGIDEPFWCVAKWSGYAQYKSFERGGLELTEHWAKRPDQMLGKCGESGSLRAAFAEALAGMYSAEEMMQATNPSSSEGIEFCHLGEAPVTVYQLRLCLANLGVKDQRRREQIIAQLRKKLGNSFDENEAAFSTAAWRAIVRDPQEYGISAEPQLRSL